MLKSQQEGPVQVKGNKAIAYLGYVPMDYLLD